MSRTILYDPMSEPKPQETKGGREIIFDPLTPDLNFQEAKAGKQRAQERLDASWFPALDAATDSAVNAMTFGQLPRIAAGAGNMWQMVNSGDPTASDKENRLARREAELAEMQRNYPVFSLLGGILGGGAGGAMIGKTPFIANTLRPYGAATSGLLGQVGGSMMRGGLPFGLGAGVGAAMSSNAIPAIRGLLLGE